MNVIKNYNNLLNNSKGEKKSHTLTQFEERERLCERRKLHPNVSPRNKGRDCKKKTVEKRENVFPTTRPCALWRAHILQIQTI